jgi:hypothetical protein
VQTYRIETIIAKDRKITIQGLPFRTGEKVEVIILSQPRKPDASKSYSLRGQLVRYDAPFEPVAEDDWNAMQ